MKTPLCLVHAEDANSPVETLSFSLNPDAPIWHIVCCLGEDGIHSMFAPNNSRTASLSLMDLVSVDGSGTAMGATAAEFLPTRIAGTPLAPTMRSCRPP